MDVKRVFLIGLGGLAAALVLAKDEPASRPQAAPEGLQPKAAASPATNRTATADYPVIGHIEKRDRTITLKSGPKGTLYSVKTKEGKVLCDNLSAEQLHAQAPELAEFIKTAVADTTGKGKAASDARVRPVTDARQ